MPQRGGGVGSRDKRVTLQQSVSVADSAGGSTTTWTPVSVIWAAVTPGSGKEFWAQRAEMPTLTHTVSVRYKKGAITPAMRLVYGTRVFTILAVVDIDEIHRDVLLYCEETVLT